MIHGQNSKYLVCKGPGTFATNATAVGANVDTAGYEWAHVIVSHPASSATNSSVKFAVLTLTHADVTNTSSQAAITGFTGTTNSTAAAGEFVLPAYNDTSVGANIVFSVDLRNKYRYMNVNVQPHATQNNYGVNFILSNSAVSPTTTTDRGVTAFVIG